MYIQLQEAINPSTLVSDGTIWRGDDWELFFAAQRYLVEGIVTSGMKV